MSDDLIKLSRRAVACRGWRWMGGMLRCSPVLEKAYFKWEPDVMPTERVRDEDPFTDADQRWSNASNAWVQMLPDLADAATIGCLLALVREAWRCPTVYVRQSTTRRVSDGVLAWEICDLWLDAEACRALGVPREGSVGSWGHGSEAEALVAALESAP
jgi:hypothetical protein